MRNFTRTEDFSKEDYEEINRRANIFEKGIKQKKENFTHLCPGMVIATEFFQESTRTAASLQAAMVKLGGGWHGISSSQGTYVDSGEEDIYDTLYGIAPLCDIMAIRHKNFDITGLAKKGFPVPLINAMCGGEEHAIAAVAMIYALKQYFGKLEGLKLGFYGMTKSSRPGKAYLKVLSRYGVNIIEDSLVSELGTPNHIQKVVRENGSQFKTDKLENFISQVDVLFVLEGLPQSGEDKKIVDMFNKNFEPISRDHLVKVKKNAVIMVGEPRATTDGRLVALKETDNDPRMRMKDLIAKIVYCNMALITYLLEVDVK